MQHRDHDAFLTGIQTKIRIRLRFFSKEDQGELTRMCAPMDFGPSRRAKNQDDRYHSWDYESDTERHTLSLLPEQIISIELTDELFDPAEFVTWSTSTSQWFVPRDWGAYS